jgi:hypothetical protein
LFAFLFVGGGGRRGDIHHTTAIFTAALTAAFSDVGITGDKRYTVEGEQSKVAVPRRLFIPALQ